MGSKTHTKQSTILTYRPPPGRCVLAPWKQHGEGRVVTWEAAQEEDGHPEGAGRQRPGGRRRREEPGEETGWTRRRRSLAPTRRRREKTWRRNGHRLQGGRPTRRSRWWRSPRRKTESQRARGMGPRITATEGGDPEILQRSRATEEPRWSLTGGRSPTEPVGRSDEAQSEERSPKAMAGRRQTKAEPEGTREPGELVDRRVTMEAREL